MALVRLFDSPNPLLSRVSIFLALWDVVQTIHRYPAPNHNNVVCPGSHALLDIWALFFKWENNPGREALFRAMRRVTVCEYEHDWYYRERMNWFCEQLFEAYLKGKWPKRNRAQPARTGLWREPLCR